MSQPRAAQLSVAAPGRPAYGSEEAANQQYLTFLLDGQLFGVAILAVKEIIE